VLGLLHLSAVCIRHTHLTYHAQNNHKHYSSRLCAFYVQCSLTSCFVIQELLLSVLWSNLSFSCLTAKVSKLLETVCVCVHLQCKTLIYTSHVNVFWSVDGQTGSAWRRYHWKCVVVFSVCVCSVCVCLHAVEGLLNDSALASLS